MMTEFEVLKAQVMPYTLKELALLLYAYSPCKYKHDKCLEGWFLWNSCGQ